MFLTQPELTEGISAICACKNREGNLRQALKSWLTCTEIDEIIIVDWSSDHPLQFLKIDWDSNPPQKTALDERIRLVRVVDEPKWILSHAYNLAAQLVTRTKIIKLDADYLLDCRFFESHPLQEGMFYAGDYQKARNSNETALCGFLHIRTKDFRIANGYNEHIVSYGYDDLDLFERLTFEQHLERRDIDYDLIQHIPHSEKDRTAHQTLKTANVMEEIQFNRSIAQLKKWDANETCSRFEIWEEEGRTMCKRKRSPRRIPLF
jgi:glycosyltransferase involved in cell wall biosynthesis